MDVGEFLVRILAVAGGILMFIIGFGNAIVRSEGALKYATEQPHSFSGIILWLYNYIINRKESLIYKSFWPTQQLGDRFYSVRTGVHYDLLVRSNNSTNPKLYVRRLNYYVLLSIPLIGVAVGIFVNGLAGIIVVFVLFIPAGMLLEQANNPRYYNGFTLRIEDDKLLVDSLWSLQIGNFRSVQIKKSRFLKELVLCMDSGDGTESQNVLLIRYPIFCERFPGHVRIEELREIVEKFIFLGGKIE